MKMGFFDKINNSVVYYTIVDTLKQLIKFCSKAQWQIDV